MKSRSKGISQDRIGAYRQTFVAHVYMLLWSGYSRLDHSRLSTLHEPAISGLLCQEIAAVLDDASSPDWVDDYEIHDDPPVHDPVREGKHRRRVDIRLASRRFRPRTHYSFEAKSLNNNAGVSDYLGKDGLGQFVSGAYSGDESMGGMLAYVQTDDCDQWCEKIESKINSNKYLLARGGNWIHIEVVDELIHTYQTVHMRPDKLGNITVIHTFLDCTI